MRNLFLLLFLSAGCLVTFGSCKGGDDDDDDAAGDADADGDGDGDGDVDGGEGDASLADTRPPDVRDTLVLDDTIDQVGPYLVETRVTDENGIDSVVLFYRVNTGELVSVPMSGDGSGAYLGAIPGQVSGSLVSYYIEASDSAGNTATDPPDAPSSVFGFEVKVKVPEVYQDDDGETTNGWAIWGEPNEDILGKALVPGGYPAYLEEVSVYLEQGSNGLFNFKVVVYLDRSGGDPADAELAWSSDAQTEGMDENYTYYWYTFDVSQALAGTPLLGGSWFVGVQTAEGQVYMGADMDYVGVDMNNWRYDGDTGAWQAEIERPAPNEGTLMVRGKGHYIGD